MEEMAKKKEIDIGSIINIIVSIKLLAKVCEENEYCSDCPLYSTDGGKCMFEYFNPISKADVRNTDAVWRAVE